MGYSVTILLVDQRGNRVQGFAGNCDTGKSDTIYLQLKYFFLTLYVLILKTICLSDIPLIVTLFLSLKGVTVADQSCIFIA